MHRLRIVGWICVLSASMLAGCEPKHVVELRYDRPAAYEIDSSVRSLGIAEFGGTTAADRKWGNIASDRLAARLDEYNRKYDRYQLVDRKRLKAILDEQDLQAAFSDSSEAIQAGKIAHVDAMIYGSVTVVTRDEPGTRTVFDPLRRTTKQVRYTKRYVMASVNFTIDDVRSGHTLATVSTMKEYDSEKDDSEGGKAVTKAMGFSSGQPPPSDQLLSHLIDECVQEFVEKISPHEVTATEELRKGKTEAVKTGNKLAAAEDYSDAMEMYLAAIEQKPDDHEAVFNAGVVCEAMERLEQAYEYYDRAFKLKPEEQYIMARKRVRTETDQR